MKTALHYILSSIVEDPEKIEIVEESDNGQTVFQITVPQADMGKVIGKEGRVIKALKNVLKIKALKENKKIHISLTEQQA